MASTSLPALRDRSVEVKRGQNPNIRVEAAVSKHWGEKRTKPKHWGFPDYYPKGKMDWTLNQRTADFKTQALGIFTGGRERDEIDLGERDVEDDEVKSPRKR